MSERQEYLSERGIEILNCMVQTWEENDAPLPGDCSYAEVLEWLDKLKADRPALLVQRLDESAQNRSWIGWSGDKTT